MDQPLRNISGDSGFQRNMGYRVEVRDGEATVTLDLAERHLNRAGIAHGGTVMALFDAAMGYACAPVVKEDGYRGLVTVSMTTNFIGPARDGALRVEGKRTGGGRKLMFCEAKAYDAAGELIATCTGTFRKFIVTEGSGK